MGKVNGVLRSRIYLEELYNYFQHISLWSIILRIIIFIELLTIKLCMKFQNCNGNCNGVNLEIGLNLSISDQQNEILYFDFAHNFQTWFMPIEFSSRFLNCTKSFVFITRLFKLLVASVQMAIISCFYEITFMYVLISVRNTCYYYYDNSMQHHNVYFFLSLSISGYFLTTQRQFPFYSCSWQWGFCTFLRKV